MSTEQVDLEIPHSGSSQVILGCTKLTFKSNHYTHLWKPSFILFFCLHGFFNSEYLIQGALYSTWVFMTSFFHIEYCFWTLIDVIICTSTAFFLWLAKSPPCVYIMFYCPFIQMMSNLTYSHLLVMVNRTAMNICL